MPLLHSSQMRMVVILRSYIATEGQWRFIIIAALIETLIASHYCYKHVFKGKLVIASEPTHKSSASELASSPGSSQPFNVTCRKTVTRRANTRPWLPYN